MYHSDELYFSIFLSPQDDKDFIESSLEDSERVQVGTIRLSPSWKWLEVLQYLSLMQWLKKLQMEDIVLCEGVQKGLESPAYSIGRYAPSVETAMHHFHTLLRQNLTDDCIVD